MVREDTTGAFARVEISGSWVTGKEVLHVIRLASGRARSLTLELAAFTH